MKNKLILAALIVLLLNESSAQLLQKFNFTGAAGSEVSLSPDGQPANGSLSSIRRGSGLIPNNGVSSFNSKDFTPNPEPDTSDYVAFSIRSNDGFTLKLDSIVFGQKRSNSGPKQYALRSSLDGFSANVIQDSTTVANSWNNKIIFGQAFSALGSAQPVELRFFGFQSPSVSGTWRLDSIRVYGSITQGGAVAKPKLSFSPSGLSFSESNGVRNAVVQLSAAASLPVSAFVAVKGGTASANSDYNAFSGTTLNFSAAAGLSQNAAVDFLDDAVQESTETLVLVLRKQGLDSDTAFDLGPDSLFTFSIQDNDVPVPPLSGPPTRTIAEIRGSNTGNQADSVGLNCRIYGTIYGVNQRLTTTAGGYQMFIRDASGGLGLFKTSSLPGIPVLNEGDSVRVMGKVECFRGLSQIVPDSMVIIATGRPLKTPDVVSNIGESQESNLVKIENLVVNPATWPSAPSGGGFTVKAFNGTDTIAIRIDNDCPLFNQPAPTEAVNFTGMVGQFVAGNPAPVAPFPATGYQLIPRRISDLEVATSISSKLLSNDFTLFPNPGKGVVILSGPAYAGSVKVTDLTGRTVKMQDSITGNTINMTDVPEGIYYIHLSGKTLRWVKQSSN